jgi:hypothetical protein
VIDGPRAEHPADVALVQEVTELFQAIDWAEEVFISARESNLGCGNSPRDAITRAFELEHSLIVLEDDCLPSPDFFPWVNELLLAFEDNKQVGAICGFQVVPTSVVETNALFWSSNLFVSGAWASWDRVWSSYSSPLGNWRSRIPRRRLIKASCYSIAGYRWLSSNWDWTNGKELDVWDHQFGASLIEHSRSVIKPPVNLVENIGFNPRGTHTRSNESQRTLPPSSRLDVTKLSWGSMKINCRADRWLMKHHYQAQPTIDWLGDLLRAGLRRATGWAS